MTPEEVLFALKLAARELELIESRVLESDLTYIEAERMVVLSTRSGRTSLRIELPLRDVSPEGIARVVSCLHVVLAFGSLGMMAAHHVGEITPELHRWLTRPVPGIPAPPRT
jgi:hypothetical protein